MLHGIAAAGGAVRRGGTTRPNEGRCGRGPPPQRTTSAWNQYGVRLVSRPICRSAAAAHVSGDGTMRDAVLQPATHGASGLLPPGRTRGQPCKQRACAWSHLMPGMRVATYMGHLQDKQGGGGWLAAQHGTGRRHASCRAGLQHRARAAPAARTCSALAHQTPGPPRQGSGTGCRCRSSWRRKLHRWMAAGPHAFRSVSVSPEARARGQQSHECKRCVRRRLPASIGPSGMLCAVALPMLMMRPRPLAFMPGSTILHSCRGWGMSGEGGAWVACTSSPPQSPAERMRRQHKIWLLVLSPWSAPGR